MENVLKEALPKEVIEVQEVIAPPVEPAGGIPWGGIGYGVIIVAIIAIATKVLSD